MISEKEAIKRAQALIRENQNEFYREYGFGFSWMQGLLYEKKGTASAKVFTKYYKLIKDLQNVRESDT